VKSRTDTVILTIISWIVSLLALLAFGFMALLTIGMTHGQEGLWFNFKLVVPVILSVIALVYFTVQLVRSAGKP
jgi:Na+/H+-dicarboxylate symporter